MQRWIDRVSERIPERHRASLAFQDGNDSVRPRRLGGSFVDAYDEPAALGVCKGNYVFRELPPAFVVELERDRCSRWIGLSGQLVVYNLAFRDTFIQEGLKVRRGDIVDPLIEHLIYRLMKIQTCPGRRIFLSYSAGRFAIHPPIAAKSLIWTLLLTLVLIADPIVASAAVSIVDGDTIRIDGERVRLWGYDAPERRQTCMIDGVERPIGEEATEGLKAILAGGELRCHARDRDLYGRTVAECWAGEQSIGDAMVRSGWAWSLPRYSKDRFLPAQEEAERAGRGIWAGHAHCEAPARFRQDHR